MKFLIAFASIIVIFAGIKAAQSLAAPFLLAVFFAMVFTQPLRWLKQKGLSDWTALSVLSLLVLLSGIGLVWILSYSLTHFVDRVPDYQEKVTAKAARFDDWINNAIQQFDQIEKSVPKIPLFLEELTEPAKSVEPTVEPTDVIAPAESTATPTPAPTPPTEPIEPPQSQSGKNILLPQNTPPKITPSYERFSLFNIIHLDTLIGYIHFGVRELLNIVTVSTLIIILVIFMLIEASRLPEKVRAAFGSNDLSNEYFKKIAADTWNYMKIKTIICLLTGFVTTVGLWLLGVEYALLWGILMFFLNYIPNIGQIIASVPPVLLTLVDQGVPMAFVVIIWLVVVNTLFGYGVEPRYLEKGLGISGLVVLLSLIFWGWLLGPIGMFLSAPLTMVLKIVLQNNRKTRWIAVLLSNHASNISPK
ncbi:MAG: AI-2E family transporter [Planctomycetaceae bacterium]|jgi:predicted PurR-regulated permease PerM|nr:AI-2E family transporter [Planctomycetaceae bacterium]